MESGINTRLKEIRKSMRLTQKEIAQKLGVNTSYYSDLETGRRKISSKTLENLKATFNVSSDWMYSGVGDKWLKNSSDFDENSVPLSVPHDVFGSLIDSVIEHTKSTIPTRYAKSLSKAQIDFEFDLAIETLKDSFSDRKTLNNTLFSLGAPDFWKEKFPLIDDSFSDFLKEIEGNFFEGTENTDSLREINKLKLVNYVYHPAIQHQRELLSKLIRYIEQYADLFRGAGTYKQKA